MAAASATAGRAAKADFAKWAEEQARIVGQAAVRGQFAPLWALAKRLSARGTNKGPRALPVILLPDGSVAQSEAEALEALAAVFTADFGVGPSASRPATFKNS